MKKEKSECEKELVYNAVYLPVRFFKKEAYIRIDDYKEVRNKREKVVEGLEEENKTLKDNVEFLHSCLDDRDKSIAIMQEENKKLKEKQKVLDKENCKLIDENVKLKKRIYQNVHGGPRIDYQEFCKKNGI